MNISLNKSINNYSLNSNSRTRENNTCVSNQSFNGLEEYSGKLAEKLIEKEGTKRFLSSKGFNKFLKSALDNPGVNEAITALLVTCAARPLTIMVTPGAKKEDKEYAATQSIASGLSGLAFAYIIFNPIKKSFENLLFKVNKNGINNAIKAVYSKNEYKNLIKELAEQGVIPNKEEFNKLSQDTDLFKHLKKFLNGSFNKNGEKSAKSKIEALLSGNDSAARTKWIKLAKDFSDALNTEFGNVKWQGVKDNSKYLVHDTFAFLKEGSYKLVKSKAADKAGSLYNYAAKFIFFPLTAFVMIYSIPTVMRLLFPNHKKSKKKANVNQKSCVPQPVNNNAQKMATSFDSTHVIKNSIFDKIQKKPAMTKQVSFSGRFSNAYNAIYEEPLAKLIAHVAEKISCSKFASDHMKKLMTPAIVEKYGVKVPLRNASGQIINKADDNFWIKNIVNIAGIWGSIFYIINTIRNKEIDPERKPALCTNMAIVAIFSAVTSASVEKISKPFFDKLMKAHKKFMGDKLTYNCEEAWAMLRRIITATFAFRYLGPVLATPAADKLVKIFDNKPKQNTTK